MIEKIFATFAFDGSSKHFAILIQQHLAISVSPCLAPEVITICRDCRDALIF